MRSLLILLLTLNLSIPAIAGPLRAPPNARHFVNDQGKAVYLGGWHTWNNFQDLSAVPNLDYATYLNTLAADGGNFFRLWNFESIALTFLTCPPGGWGTVSPLPFERSGPGTALDGKPKFNLVRYNAAFFDRLRERVALASNKGIYVMVMLFEASAPISGSNFAWSPYNAANNVNGGFSKASDVFTLNSPAMTGIYDAYIRKVIDTLNEFDNVIFEPANEPQVYSSTFISHVIDVVHEYERSKPKQHPVIYSSYYSDANYILHAAGNADGIAPGATLSNWDPVLYVNPKKPWIMDTDHIFLPSTGGFKYVWKCLLRGYNFTHMDSGVLVCPSIGWALPDAQIRRAAGDTVRFANRIDLAHMEPSTTISSTTYALQKEGEYLVWQPSGSSPFTVYVAAGTYDFEWFSPSTSTFISRGSMTVGAGNNTFAPPAGQYDGIVLYLKRTATAPPPPVVSGPVYNPSFESGGAGWIVSGNLAAVGSASYKASDGVRLLVFNWGQTAPNGIASQAFPTKAAQRYTLHFDVGVIGWNQDEQRLLVEVVGNKTLSSKTISVVAAGNGATTWTPQSITFTTDSTSTILKFTDISVVTHNLDLLLDNIRVTEDGTSPPPEPPVTPSAPTFANGSFESGSDGWSISGFVRTTKGAGLFTAQDGEKLTIFNGGDMPCNGIVSQTFATSAGQAYTLTFRVGVVAYNNDEQRLKVDVLGAAPLLSQSISITGNGYATAKWLPQTYTFTANSASTTLTFRDTSTETRSLDLLLDDVRIR